MLALLVWRALDTSHTYVPKSDSMRFVRISSPVVLSELRTVVLPSMVHLYTSGVSPVAVQLRVTSSPATAVSISAILTEGPTAQNIKRLSPVVN